MSLVLVSLIVVGILGGIGAATIAAILVYDYIEFKRGLRRDG